MSLQIGTKFEHDYFKAPDSYNLHQSYWIYEYINVSRWNGAKFVWYHNYSVQ